MWLNEKLIMRRDQRGCMQAPFRHMDSYWHKINFSKNYTLETPAVIRVYSTGLFNIAIDDAALSVPQNPDGSYTIPAGSGRLTVDVYTDNTLPSIFVDDERLYSDANWFATYNNSQELHADCSEFDAPENPPTNYRLACKPMPHAAKKAAVAVGMDMQLSGTLYDFVAETFGYITLDGISGSGRIYVLYGETEAEAMSIDYCESFDCVDTDGIKRDRWVWGRRCLPELPYELLLLRRCRYLPPHAHCTARQAAV